MKITEIWKLLTMNFFSTCKLALAFILMSTTLVIAQDEKVKTDPERAFLGIRMQKVESGEGIMVTLVVEGSPAENKLQAKDVILKFGGTQATELKQISELAQSHKPGDVVKLAIQRDGKDMEVEVTLAARPTMYDDPEEDSSSGFTAHEFESVDGLKVTADSYANVKGENVPFIVLCHQAGWSRGEYREIAPKLNQLGFNCVAIDQRSGGEVNEVKNETFARAKAEGKDTNFTDAEQDIIAALKAAKKSNPNSKIILWGSSYSSALSLRIAGEHPELIDGVLAFAPGEYFERFGKPADWIANSAKNIKVPAFITSAKNEAPKWQSIYDAIPGDAKSKFVPETKGNHGSRALWEKFDDHGEYWKSVEAFLAQFK
jgi:pimeloyl-ACP methyl ester carboxylesterase